MRIAVTSKSFSKNSFLVKKLKEKYPQAELVLQLGDRGLNKKELVAFLTNCEGAIIGLEQIDQSLLSLCPKLKCISKFGVGLNNIDLNQCEIFGVQVGWTGGVNKRSVAEMALGFMIGLSRNLFTSSYYLKEGKWNKAGGFQLSEKTVGIIGVGHIGKDLIKLLAPFDCKILVNDIVDQADYYKSVNVSLVSKEVIYNQADIISIHTPFNQETENLLNLDVFKSCLKKPYIINTARGGIIKEDDMVTAIEAGYISGIAIDAYVSEPLDIASIYSHKNIICTPHIGGNATEAVLAMGMSAIENLNI